MKSVLYVGATLMIGASIYGFVDYNKTSHNKEFKNMYSEKKVIDPNVISDNKITEPVIEKGDKKNIGEITVTKNTIVKNSSSGQKNVNTRIKKKRTFNSKMFSRGGLEERFIELKEDAKKPENKEQ
jgi:hypothetical protein